MTNNRQIISARFANLVATGEGLVAQPPRGDSGSGYDSHINPHRVPAYQAWLNPRGDGESPRELARFACSRSAASSARVIVIQSLTTEFGRWRAGGRGP